VCLWLRPNPIFGRRGEKGGEETKESQNLRLKWHTYYIEGEKECVTKEVCLWQHMKSHTSQIVDKKSHVIIVVCLLFRPNRILAYYIVGEKPNVTKIYSRWKTVFD